MSLADSVIKHLQALRDSGADPARATIAGIAEGFKVERRDIPRLLAMAVSKGQLRRGQDANLQFFFELGSEAAATSVHSPIAIENEEKEPAKVKKSAPAKHLKSTQEKAADPIQPQAGHKPKMIGTNKYKIDISLLTVEVGVSQPCTTAPGVSAWDELFKMLPKSNMSVKFPANVFSTIEAAVERKNKRAGRKQWRVTKVDSQNGRLFHL